MGRAAVVFDLDFSNVFITVSRKIFTEKLINYGLDEPNSSENWQNREGQRLVISHTGSRWRLITNASSKKSSLGPIHFHTVCMLGQNVPSASLLTVQNLKDSWYTRGLFGLLEGPWQAEEMGFMRNHMKFKAGKEKVLQTGKEEPQEPAEAEVHPDRINPSVKGFGSCHWKLENKLQQIC